MTAQAHKLNALPDSPDADAAPNNGAANAPQNAPDNMRAAPQKAPAAGNIWGLMLIAVIVVATGVMAFPSFIIIAAGMPPALAAALVDNRPGRHVSYCVIAANLAGIAPVLSSLWVGGNNIAIAMLLLSDVYVWLGMYGAAALGWALIWMLSVIAEFLLAFMANLRARKLRTEQESMIDEWGPYVSGDEAV